MTFPVKVGLGPLRSLLESEFGVLGRLLFKVVLLLVVLATMGITGFIAWYTLAVPLSHLVPDSWQVPEIAFPSADGLMAVLLVTVLFLTGISVGAVLAMIQMLRGMRAGAANALGAALEQSGAPDPAALAPQPSKRDP